MSLTIKIINDFNEFAKLRQPWNELAAACETDHAFMRHEWFECWLKILGDPSRIAVLTACQDGLLVAAAPLQIGFERFRRIPLRALSFQMSAISPRCNFLIHPSCSGDQVFGALLRMRSWDIMALRGLEAGLETTRRFVDYLERHYAGRYEIKLWKQSPYLIVKGDWNSYLETLSKKHCKNINQGMNRMSRLGGYTFERCSDAGRFAEIYENILTVSEKSWKAQGQSSIGALPAQKAFYQEFCRIGEGLWEMRVLWAGPRCIGFNFFLRSGDRLTGIRTDFDEEFRYYGPGQMMILLTLMDLFASGRRWEFDMGGMAAHFKLDWTSTVRDIINVTAFRRGVPGSLLLFAKKRILPLIRRAPRPGDVDATVLEQNEPRDDV